MHWHIKQPNVGSACSIGQDCVPSKAGAEGLGSGMRRGRCFATWGRCCGSWRVRRIMPACPLPATPGARWGVTAWALSVDLQVPNMFIAMRPSLFVDTGSSAPC